MDFDGGFWKIAGEVRGKEKVQKNKNDSKKIRMHRKWGEGFVMKSIGGITESTNTKSKKRYVIHFVYQDQNGKQHKASVRFGLKDKKYLVDSGDKEQAKIFSQSCRNLKNIFHHNYWEMYLLNTCKTIQEAHARYRIQNNLL